MCQVRPWQVIHTKPALFLRLLLTEFLHLSQILKALVWHWWWKMEIVSVGHVKQWCVWFLSLGFEGVPVCVELLCGDFCVLQDFLVHCCIDSIQSAHAGFLSFVLTAHGKDYSVLLSCFALCRSNWIFHFFVVFWDAQVLLDCVLSSFMWLSFKMAFARPHWIQFYCVAIAYPMLLWQVWGKTRPWVCHLCEW